MVAILDSEVRAGVASVVVGLGWTIAGVIVLDPRLPTETLTAAQAFAASGTAPLAEARNLLINPTTVLGDLFAQNSLPILVALLAPLLFLPLSGLRSLIPAVPPLVLGIAAGQAVQEAAEPGVPESFFGAAMAVVAVVPITIAGLVAISRIGRRSITRINVDHRIVASIVAASLILFVQNAPSSPYQQPWDWGGRDQVDRARLRAVEGVGPTVALTVSPQLSAEVAERKALFETPLGPPAVGTVWQPTTRIVLLDTTAEGSDGEPLWDEDDRRDLLGSLGGQGYAREVRGRRHLPPGALARGCGRFVAAGPQRLAEPLGRGVEPGRVGVAVGRREVELGQVVEGDQVDVGVGHLVADHQHPHPAGSEGGLLGPPDVAGHLPEVRGEVGSGGRSSGRPRRSGPPGCGRGGGGDRSGTRRSGRPATRTGPAARPR